ncbi:MAG: aminotransferase class V-fold PLP-dependent enzyme [Methanocalculus sp. MSAO_Arc1]|uniref:aminotransferase class V-fold PLP-dependent enzyme n=1 Tax=Methanocalculus TaxID=71151 RepID=UPI000FF8201F|nr:MULTISPECIES: aminotransferase class V-fold PLP-dependent enzyme [unclassified Methanocalculus]MCP1662374.1 cysteine desulfurase/selenocysteine lyase [Methanocalculus sp. AMF5]RQD81380.1 MAG: aminotransferase class V-fold PLP-dependent enzyme [Methanocalculus sp. MSAO_Arc1]
MRTPAVKETLYWCDTCNLPLIGRRCGCGAEGRGIPLLEPYDLRPALRADRDLIGRLLFEQFGAIPLPDIILLNKTGGRDRSDLIIMNGSRFGWLSFDPISRQYSLDIAPESLPYLLVYATNGIVNLDEHLGDGKKVRIGGKRFPLRSPVPDGTVIVSYRKKYGTGVVRDGSIRVKELAQVDPGSFPNPDWKRAIDQNLYHLRLLERDAIRVIKKHANDRPTANVSFSGGKDSAAVLHLARKAGVTDAFFLDTGIELPETIAYIESQNIEIIREAGDFYGAVKKAGPPGKDHRWCCKLLKLQPLRIYLSRIGPVVTFQGNRWYESWNRADLEEASQNPANPLQLNISPIRNWRAFEVYLYLWWQEVEINPLYDMGFERIGCYLCPAMLESEYDLLRSTHPALAARWDAFLRDWADSKGLPKAYHAWGLWRWKALPPKMRELCREHGIPVNNDYTLKEGEPVISGVKPETPDEANAASGDTYPIVTIRRDFPILQEGIYLDSAATSFSPDQVVETFTEFEHNYRANVGRGIHRLTRIASQRYWHAHEIVGRFIGGEAGTTVFTKNTTESINMVAHGLPWERGDRVITTILEHHSNLLPWRALGERGVELRVIGITEEYALDLNALEEELKGGARLVAVTHASNAIGILTPVAEIAALCKEYDALLLIDAAQTIPHIPVNVREIGCDFCCFSGHKMLGPTGTGVLWMKDPSISPMMVGGGMIQEVRADSHLPAPGYEQFEAGTPNISGGIGLGRAARYLEDIGMSRVRDHEERLTSDLIRGLRAIEGVDLYAADDPASRIGVVSFTISGLHPHEAAERLDEDFDIFVRSGHHCCQPLMEYLQLQDGTIRASIGLYTAKEEIDLLVAAVADITRSL